MGEISRPPYEITHDGKLPPYDLIRRRELWSLLVLTENLGFQCLLLYNFTCSCCSAATWAAFLYGLWHSEHIFDKTPQPALQLAFRLYWLCKLGELLDTVFMVLRHRRHQISVLHVYHHASMLLLSEFAWQHSAWPAIAVLLALNSFIHSLPVHLLCLEYMPPSVCPVSVETSVDRDTDTTVCHCNPLLSGGVHQARVLRVQSRVRGGNDVSLFTFLLLCVCESCKHEAV